MYRNKAESKAPRGLTYSDGGDDSGVFHHLAVRHS
jgi:hypothetical protein